MTTLTSGQIRDFGDPSLEELGYKLETESIIDTTRWELVHEVLLRKLDDNTFWVTCYRTGATESQETDWETECELNQVYPTLTFKTEYTAAPAQAPNTFTAKQAQDAMGQIAAAKFANLAVNKGDVVLIAPAFDNQRPWTEQASTALMQALHPMEGLMLVIPPGAGIQSLSESAMNAEGWYRREHK